MKKFLVLTKDIINVKYIQNIIIKDNKYIINLYSNKFNGVMIYGSGFISNNNDGQIIIKKNDNDYKKIIEFIKSI